MQNRSVQVQPLVSLEEANVSLQGSLVLRNISWQLRPAENWAILGPNGSGKSTLLRLIRGDLRPDPDSTGRRIYSFNGTNESSPVDARKQMGFVGPELQDRYRRATWNLSGEEVVASGWQQMDLAYHRPTARQERRQRALLRNLGLTRLSRRPVSQLSTGEFRRLLIARALVAGPRVILLDEVCDGLDARARDAFMGWLEALPGSGTQILYTTHRDDELLPSVTHVALLDQGWIQRQGPRNDLVPPRTSRQAADRRSSLRPSELQTLAHPLAPTEIIQGGSEDWVRIQNATLWRGGRPVLRRFNWSLRSNENWAVVGPNGAGKTTLALLIVGELHPAYGGGVERFPPHGPKGLPEVRHWIGHVSSESQAFYREPISCEQVVASGFFGTVGLLDPVRPDQWRRVRTLMRAYDLQSIRNRSICEVSYGQARLVLLLRSQIHAPKLLVLDEPFDGLDENRRRQMIALLNSIHRSGTRLVLITHHLEDLPPCINRLLILDGRGRTRTKALFQNPVGG